MFCFQTVSLAVSLVVSDFLLLLPLDELLLCIDPVDYTKAWNIEVDFGDYSGGWIADVLMGERKLFIHQEETHRVLEL